MPDRLEAAIGTSATLEIDLDAVAANWRDLRARAAPADCAAVVKADGYGLGAAEIARRLQAEGCTWFFVAHLEEGLALRRVLAPQCRVVVLNGLLPGTADAYLAADLLPALNDRGQIGLWSEAARAAGRRLGAVIHLDTGMNRLGLDAAEAAALAEDPAAFEGIVPLLWISHLVTAEAPTHPLNAIQLDRFRAALARLPRAPASLANSSGIFLGPDYAFDLVRPGAALYGVNPQPERANPLRPTVRLTGKILQLRHVDTHWTVGYGAQWQAPRPSRIATVGVGYADGYLRSLGNRGVVAIDGRRVPIVGRVSMDLITIDVTDIPESRCAPGQSVELIGPAVPVDEIAALAGTIGYELLTDLGPRYRRRYIGSVA